MIVMLDSPPSSPFDVSEKELGFPVEQLFTPLTRFNPQRPDDHFAIDNGAFSSFNARGFLSCLEKHEPRKSLCRFVAVPDVVGSAIRTLECFDHWRKKIDSWPLALVAQDGQEHLPIPWDQIAAVFIGGTTHWKLSKGAAAIVKAAKVVGKWAHVGRINTPDRFDYFRDLGADSCDGSGLARYSHMREAIRNDQISAKIWTE